MRKAPVPLEKTPDFGGLAVAVDALREQLFGEFDRLVLVHEENRVQEATHGLSKELIEASSKALQEQCVRISRTLLGEMRSRVVSRSGQWNRVVRVSPLGVGSRRVDEAVPELISEVFMTSLATRRAPASSVQVRETLTVEAVEGLLTLAVMNANPELFGASVVECILKQRLGLSVGDVVSGYSNPEPLLLEGLVPTSIPGHFGVQVSSMEQGSQSYVISMLAGLPTMIREN